MLLNKIIDSYVTFHYEIARMKIHAHLSFSKREALRIRLPSMKRNKSFKKQKKWRPFSITLSALMKNSWKKHLSTTNYTFKTKIRIFHQNHGLSLKSYQFKTTSTSSFTAYKGFFFYFLDNIGKKNVFYDILERKNVSLSCKTKKLKKSKKWDFSKRVNPWFSSKIVHLSIFLF